VTAKATLPNINADVKFWNTRVIREVGFIKGIAPNLSTQSEAKFDVFDSKSISFVGLSGCATKGSESCIYG